MKRQRKRGGAMWFKKAKRKESAERRVNKIFRKPGAPGVWSWVPGVSAPSGGLEPKGREWEVEENGVENWSDACGLGGVKVRRDKRASPDGAEEPLAATAYEGEEKIGRERGPGLVLSRGIRCCSRQWRGGSDGE